MDYINKNNNILKKSNLNLPNLFTQLNKKHSDIFALQVKNEGVMGVPLQFTDSTDIFFDNLFYNIIKLNTILL